LPDDVSQAESAIRVPPMIFGLIEDLWELFQSADFESEDLEARDL
jgi:hypothetical protein